MGAKAQLLRDIRKRLSAEQMEVQRRAFLYVARNTTLPATVRHKAQLGLNTLNGGEGRMGAVKNRCWETGRGRGVISKFGLCRVSTCIVAFADSSSSNSEQKLSVENFQAFIKQAGRTDDVNHVFLHPCLPISFLWYFHRRTMDSSLGRTISK
ncbi:hypothetical protein AYX13_01497 [Cryptococcus neoformans]|nr:hypothetical protein AYX13_01497 [Cryptococcus neoformans var. grubii]